MSELSDKVWSLLEETVDWYRNYKNEDQRLRERELSLGENEFETGLRKVQGEYVMANGGPQVGSYGKFKVNADEQRAFKKEASELKAEAALEDIEKPAEEIASEPFEVWTLEYFEKTKKDYEAVQKDIAETIGKDDQVSQDVRKAGRGGIRRYRTSLKKQLDHWVGLKVIGEYSAKCSTIKLQDTLLKVLEIVVLEAAEKIVAKDMAEEITEQVYISGGGPDSAEKFSVTTGESKADEADTETESSVAEATGTEPEVENPSATSSGFSVQEIIEVTTEEGETKEEQPELSVNGKPVAAAPSAFKIENGELDTDPDTSGFGFDSELVKTLENPDTPSKSKDGTEIGKSEFQIVGMKYIHALTEKNQSGALKYAEYIKRTAIRRNPDTGEVEYVTTSSQIPVSQYALLVEGMCTEIKVSFSDIVGENPK